MAAALVRRQQPLQRLVEVPQREGGLRGGDIKHHDLIQMIPLAEVLQVGLDVADGGPEVGEAVGRRQVGQLADRLAGVEDRAGPNIRRPFVQLRQAGLGDRGIVDVGPLLHLADGLAEVGLADIVAADDELGRHIQLEAVEEGQGGHQGGGVGQAAARAARPRAAVVPTPPKAPIIHKPTRR